MEKYFGGNSERGTAMSRFFRAPRTGVIAAVLGLLLMAFGIYRGEMSVVLEKAINICMECIGIG